MTVLRVTIVCGLIAAAGLGLTALATLSSDFMPNASTNSWEFHVELNVLTHESHCSSAQKVCAAYDQNGQCTTWHKNLKGTITLC